MAIPTALETAGLTAETAVQTAGTAVKTAVGMAANLQCGTGFQLPASKLQWSANARDSGIPIQQLYNKYTTTIQQLYNNSIQQFTSLHKLSKRRLPNREQYK